MFLDFSLTAFSDTPVAEPIPGETTDVPESASGNVPQAELKEPATEPVPVAEPEAAAITHVPAHSYAKGNAPTADHTTASEPIVTVASTGNGSIADQPTVEGSALKAEASITEDWQVVADESVFPAEESAAPAPAEFSHAVVDTPVETPVAAAEGPTLDDAEVAPPTPAEISVPLTEDPVPAPEQSGPAPLESPTPDEAPVPEAVSQTPEESPAPVPEEPALTETTANSDAGAPVAAAEGLVPDAEAAPTPTEIPAPVTEDLAPASEPSVLALPETPTPDDPAPIPEGAAVVATSQPPTDSPLPVPDEPTITETAVPATVETQVPDADGSPTQEPAVLVPGETNPANENHPFGMEGTVDEVPAADGVPAVEEAPAVEGVLESEQVAQVPAALTIDETTAIVVPQPSSEVATASETTVETQAPGVEGSPIQELAVLVPGETVPVDENRPLGMEGTVDEVPAVEGSLELEQVAQEPAAHTSDETTAIAAPEPGSEVATASETEAVVDT
jgi:hypothetical protein